MNERENLLKAIRRENPDHIPYSITLCDSLINTFKEKTGSNDYMEYFNLPYRYVGPGESKKSIDYMKYYKNLPKGTFLDGWGVARVPGSVAHFTKMIHPMMEFTTPEEVREYPFPDLLDDYRWQGFEKKVQKIQEMGLAAVYFAIHIFEYAWYLRGLENLLMDMMTDEDMASACLDKMTDIQCKLAQRLARGGVDIIIYGDDVGAQHSMMINPELWRNWLKPTMKKAINAAKSIKPDLIAVYHSDGVIYEIIPDLIEIGVDVLNPVQPECMNPILINKLYGDKLSFWGTIGTQTTMPFGNPGDVEAAVKLMAEEVGKGGGLVIAPTHLLEPEVPWENIEVFIEAVQKYGKY